MVLSWGTSKKSMLECGQGAFEWAVSAILLLTFFTVILLFIMFISMPFKEPYVKSSLVEPIVRPNLCELKQECKDWYAKKANFDPKNNSFFSKLIFQNSIMKEFRANHDAVMNAHCELVLGANKP